MVVEIFFHFFLRNGQFTKSRWVLCTMSETVPTYLTTKEVLAHLRVGRDALRSWRNDSERYGVFCPCINIARPPRVMYQWGTGRDNPYREIERWRDAIAACRKSHRGRYPNGYTPRPVVPPPKASKSQGRRRSILRDLPLPDDNEDQIHGQHKQDQKSDKAQRKTMAGSMVTTRWKTK